MNTNTSIARHTKPQIETEICKAIIITIAGHLLAIPVSTVYKVIRSSLDYSTDNIGTNEFKLVNLDDRVLPVIDLHNILAKIKPSNNLEYTFQSLSNEDKFFVLAKSNQGKISAIYVDTPPTLMDLPLKNTYLLPSYEQNNIGHIASHIAVVPFQQSNLTILLLDIQQALDAVGFNR